MKTDILAYKAQLESKLAAVNDVIAGMGGKVTTKAKGKGKGGKGKPRKKRTAAQKKAASEAAKARWAKIKAAKK